MGVQKQGSKGGGGYVGGFLQLFDWNAKSRKKLFSTKSDLPERSKQGRQIQGNFPSARLHLVDEVETAERSSIKGSSDYSCASSVTDEEGCGTRAPGVVARLMGLDALPTSNFTEPYSTPYFDTQSLQNAQYHQKNFDLNNDHQFMHSGNLLSSKVEPARNAAEPRSQRVLNRPIEKFQTEILPPKSAKTIPITHHKLLSPIKSPGFFPTKNAAHIMEAAVRIIDSGPQATNTTSTKSKMPHVGSSSVPLKVRDLKEKMEATQKQARVSDASSRRPVESSAVNYLKGHSLNKSWSGSVDTPFRVSSDADEASSSSKGKGKSISLAVQAKVNVQRREGLNLNTCGNRSTIGQREQSEFKSNQPVKRQQNIHKNTHKKNAHNASSALRQNNQKQNCGIDKEKPSKVSISNSQGRKSQSGNSSKFSGNPKVGSRKLGMEINDSEKDVLYSRANNLPRKKRFIENQVGMEVEKNDKLFQSNVGIDRHFDWAEDSRRKGGMDVVSFTFTAPMTRSALGFEVANRVAENDADYRGTKMSSLGFNVIGGDALSVLLEQKLRELSSAVESSSSNSVRVGTAGTSLDAMGATPSFRDNRFQHGLCTDRLGNPYVADFSRTDPETLRMKHSFQRWEETDECSNTSLEARKLDCRQPSPVSVLEPSCSTESWNYSDSTDSNTTDGSKQYSSVQVQESLASGSLKKLRSVEADTDLSDSASSILTKKHELMISKKDVARSTKWELNYVKMILGNVELMFYDFALGRTKEIISPCIFDQLEINKDDDKPMRKVLFDCVCECVNLRCRGCVVGGSETFGKGLLMVKRKERLAEEVYKEISGLRAMGDWMVDELVDKDMSNLYGRWLDFEIEGFEFGVEIEVGIFDSLVDEVVADILQLRWHRYRC